jgi:hypothetical protein
VAEWTIGSRILAWSGSGIWQNSAFEGGSSYFDPTMVIDFAGQSSKLAFDFYAANGFVNTTNGLNPQTASLTPKQLVYTNNIPDSITLKTDQGLNMMPYQGPKLPLPGSPYGTPIVFVYVNLTASPSPDYTNQEDSSSG